jgi:hypothetical protein
MEMFREVAAEEEEELGKNEIDESRDDFDDLHHVVTMEI